MVRFFEDRGGQGGAIRLLVGIGPGQAVAQGAPRIAANVAEATLWKIRF